MTREQAKELLPIIQAFAEGKTIEFRNSDGEWEEAHSPTWNIRLIYRIKQEPKYRPFKSQEECWQEMQKHQPFGWVKDENCNYECITRVSGNYSYSEHLKTVTFADGTPFGIKEK